MKVLEVKDFFELSLQYPVIDVRTPAEYEHGHIPGACNIPLFTNEERVEIGILYKQQGRKVAMLRGMELVSPRFTQYLKSAEKLSASDTLLMHCWRGGMRSAAMAWLLEWYGFNVCALRGGYKSFRHLVLNTFSEPYKLYILGGRTGSGKTLILQELAAQGQTIIDLEKTACHKGSAFGSLGEATQPTQEMFENELAVKLLTIPQAKAIWVEDESQNIGKRIISGTFFQQMRAAIVYYIDLPIQARLGYLVKSYGQHSKEELIASIHKIEKRLGPQHAKAAKQAIEQGDIEKACAISLVYYDKSYGHGIGKRLPDRVIKKAFTELHPEKIANELIKLTALKQDAMFDLTQKETKQLQ